MKFFGLLVFLYTSVGYSVDNTRIMDRYIVVGVISGAKDNKDVAVIKDKSTNRSLTVIEGTNVGGESGITIKKIEGRSVTITDGVDTATIGYEIPKLDTSENYSSSEIEDEEVRVFAESIRDLNEAVEAPLQGWSTNETATDGVNISEYAYRLLQQQRIEKSKSYVLEESPVQIIDVERALNQEELNSQQINPAKIESEEYDDLEEDDSY